MFHPLSTEVGMQFFKTVLLALALIVSGLSNPVFAGDKDPLFIALSSDATRRVGHVLHFAELQRARGHSLTIWLNESGILLASRKYAEKHADHQKALAELMSKGATVLICHYCMQQFDVEASDLLPGFKIGSPELLGNALFKDDTKTLSW
jgi:predicted peroxiredoxin